jgi:hypothetical protein
MSGDTEREAWSVNGMQEIESFGRLRTSSEHRMADDEVNGPAAARLEHRSASSHQ